MSLTVRPFAAALGAAYDTLPEETKKRIDGG